MLYPLWKRTTVFILAACIIVAAACKKSDSGGGDGGQFAEKGKTIISGIVMNEAYAPVSGAEIIIGTITLHSDENGVFMAKDVPVTAGETYLLCKKAGYFNSTRTLTTADGGVTQCSMMLSEKKQVQQFAATAGISATVNSQAKVQIPANGIRKADGTAYTGNVTMASRYINPGSVDFALQMPGGDLSAVDANEQSRELYSYGAVEVLLNGSNGEDLQLKNGTLATLTFPIQAGQLANAPATMPLWYFDETKGKWIEQGILTKQGNQYVGTVGHFTAWNADKPMPPAEVYGTITYCDGTPAKGVPVMVGGETVLTNESGYYSVIVCSGEKLPVRLVAYYGATVDHILSEVGPLGANQRKEISLRFNCMNETGGQLSLCDGKPDMGSVTARWDGGTAYVISDPGGRFTLTLPKDKDVTLTPYGIQSGTGASIVIPAGTTKKDLGQLKLCQNAAGGRLSFTVNGGDLVNKNIVMDQANPAGVAEAVYERGDDGTRFFKFGGNFSAVFSMNGKSLGNQDDFQMNISYTNADGSGQYILQSIEGETTLTITKYGAVGDRVEGTFSGRFKQITAANPTGTGVFMQITKGQFSLIRVIDEE